MKVLFSIDSLQQGGAEQSIANLISNFSSDLEVIVLYFYSDARADLLPLYQKLPCRIYSLNLKGKYDWKKGIQGMREILRKEKPSLVVSSLYRSNIISRFACRYEHVRLIGTIVDDPYNLERKKTFRGLNRIKFHLSWLLDRVTINRVYGWISNSESIGISNAQILGIKLSTIKVVYRGRKSTDFQQWTCPESDHFIFATIGRLFEKKGYPELIQAFHMIHKKFSHARLMVYGEGSYRGEIEKLISEYGLAESVILKGNVPSAWKELYKAHCFVFPSRFEGFSGALVEALMTGIPVICSDIPMNLEAIIPNETAIVHTLKDPQDLAAKMQYAMSNYPAMIEMGQKARENTINRFDIKNIASQYERTLKEFAGKN